MATNLPAPQHRKMLHIDQIELADTALAVLDNNDSQYRLLKPWTVGHHGSFIDGLLLISSRFERAQYYRQPLITLQRGVRYDAAPVGVSISLAVPSETIPRIWCCGLLADRIPTMGRTGYEGPKIVAQPGFAGAKNANVGTSSRKEV